MDREEMNKYAYELMVKNNPEEAVKQLLLKDKENENLKDFNNKLQATKDRLDKYDRENQIRIDKAIEYVEEHQPVFEITSKQHLQEFFENEYYVELLKILKGE